MRKLKGVYLVADPAMKRETLIGQLKSALRGGVDIIQLWNHWPVDAEKDFKIKLVKEVLGEALEYEVPVLINEDWKLAVEAGADGVHFDEIPEDWFSVKQHLAGRLIGFTAGNDLQRISWTQEQEADYLSFCAMFPSSSVDSCEIVRPGSVLKAREIADMPLFLSGGILPENLEKLAHLDFQGVAVISGIMNANDPEKEVQRYKSALKTVLEQNI